MKWHEEDEHEPSHERGLLLALIVLLIVGGFAAWGLGFFGAAGLQSSQDLQAAMSRAAQRLGSEVATSARAVLPIGGHIAKAVKVPGVHPHIVPTKGKAVSPKTQHFTFDGVKYSVTAHVATDVYWGAKKSTRLLVQYPGESDETWTSTYYHDFADDPAQRVTIDDVCSQLRAIKKRSHLGQDQYLELIAKYVQSIPYDWAVYQAGTGNQRFPVETLIDGKGLCGDKSVLLADLLSHEGYAVALLDFNPEKHMAVGVLGPGKVYPDTGYLFLETTSPCYVTDVPTEYTGGMHLTSRPQVIPIGSGTLQYGAADQIAKIVHARDTAQAAAETLYADARSKSLSDAEVTKINAKLSQAYKAEISLRSNVIDRNGDAVGTFMDRTVALAWITRNAWWL